MPSWCRAGRERSPSSSASPSSSSLSLARLYLGVDHPFDDLTAVAIGVVIPLLAFRFFTPNEFFPVAYRRGKTAHLDVTGPRGAAIRQAVQDQLGLTVVDSKPVGLAGSGGSTPLRLRIAGDPDTYLFGKLYAMNHVRADRWYKLGPDDPLRQPRGRAVVQVGAPADPARGLRDAPVRRRRTAHGAVGGHRRADPRARVPARHRVLRRCRGDRRRRGRRPDHRRRAGPPASALERRRSPIATSSRPTSSSRTATCTSSTSPSPRSARPRGGRRSTSPT